MTCRSCGASNEKPICDPILQLHVQNIFEKQTVNRILQSSFSHTENLDDYTCELGANDEGCKKTGTCSKGTRITKCKDTVVIQLNIFENNPITNVRSKILPNLEVDNKINIFEDYYLQGIIWHHGHTIASGHYTSMVKHNESWYHMNDHHEINVYPNDIVFECKKGEERVPYLLIYKKGTDLQTTTSITVNDPCSNDGPSMITPF